MAFSYNDYLRGKCTHHEYYAQFAPIFMRAVRSRWSKEYLQEKLAEDKNLNNIPLNQWDHLSRCFKQEIAGKNKELGNGSVWSLSTGVCAAKAAAKIIAEEQ